MLREKTADILRGNSWILREVVGKPIRSTTQIWVVTSHQCGIFALVPQTSSRGKVNRVVAKCRLFSQASPISNL